MTEMAAAARGPLTAAAALAPVMQNVTWHSFDLRSGRRGPQMVMAGGLGTVSRILNEATETTLEVRIWEDGAPVPDWESSTLPGRVMLVALDDQETPIWGGMVYRRLGDAGETVSLNLVTLEAYFDRRYVNADVTFTDADQVSDIAADMIATTLTYGIEFTIDAPFSNWSRDRTYLIDEDKTILSILQELAGVENGIEFTVDLGWADDDKMILDRIVRVRNTLGTAYLGSTGTESDRPIAIFHMPGSVTDFQYLEDYGSEFGANMVVAVSSGEGDTRPESANYYASPNVVAGFGGPWAAFERRFTPSTSIIDTATLDAHAIRELRETWDGMNELTLEANLDTAPRLNSDWFLGDDVAVSLTCPRFPERTNSDGEVVPGYQSNARCIGWEVDFDARRVKPRLLETTEVEVEAL